MDRFFDRLIAFFTSLRLTVACLVFGMSLVFLGTMGQEPMGNFLAQQKFFHSFFVTAGPMWAAIKKSLEMVHLHLTPSSVEDILYGPAVPVFPGGYLVGGVLVINLIASASRRFGFHWRKVGIWMAHVGLLLLLLGQLLTDQFSRETFLHLREDGPAKNYSESQQEDELAVSDTTQADSESVVAIPQSVLMREGEIRQPELPFAVRINRFFVNAHLEALTPGSTLPAAATQGAGLQATVRALPPVTDMRSRNLVAAVVEIVSPQGSLGTWLVSEVVSSKQSFVWNNRTYELALRLRRFYKPFSLQLVEFRHDVYSGTDIPRNFSSRVLLRNQNAGESREVVIRMNEPLRYGGETFYQADWDHEDERGTILQVVHNPSWLTPYFACIVVGLGLLAQFSISLMNFASKQRQGGASKAKEPVRLVAR